MTATPTVNDYNNESIRAAVLQCADPTTGEVHVQTVVDRARDESNPMHDIFTWDDTEAAEKYRLIQAGALIRRIKIVILRPEPETRRVAVKVTRALQSRGTMRTSGGGYEGIKEIMSDEAKRADMLATALSELKALKKRYSGLAELQGVWAVLDELQEVPA